MNLLHLSLLSQQQKRQSKQIICPVCQLPAAFTFAGHQRDENGSSIETWECGSCEVVVPLNQLWPIARVPRVLAGARRFAVAVAEEIERDRVLVELA